MWPRRLAPLHSPDEDRVRIALDAYCWTCQTRHTLDRTPQHFTQEMWDWEVKHRGHEFEFLSTKRRMPTRFWDTVFQKCGLAPWWLTTSPNASIKISYTASVALTCTMASLASSSTFVAGREATAVVNTSNLYLDYRVTAKIMTGTTPTVDREMRVYAYAALNDTPLYPDVFTGTDGARAVTNAYILDSTLLPLGSSGVSGTSSVAYFPRCLTMAQAFGFCPQRWGLFLTHNTAVNLDATAGNHVLTALGAYLSSV